MLERIKVHHIIFLLQRISFFIKSIAFIIKILAMFCKNIYWGNVKIYKITCQFFSHYFLSFLFDQTFWRLTFFVKVQKNFFFHKRLSTFLALVKYVMKQKKKKETKFHVGHFEYVNNPLKEHIKIDLNDTKHKIVLALSVFGRSCIM